MRRISTSTRVVDKFGAGKDGFTNGNAVSGIAATDLEDVWFDHVQEEIANAVESSGQTLNPADRTQLSKAFKGRLIRTLVYTLVSGVQNVSIDGGTPTTTGASSYVPSSAMTFAIAKVQGGGGGGGGTATTAASQAALGSGGASGSLGVSKLTAAQIGASQTVTVGAAGAFGGASGAGGNGGASSLGSLITAPGGGGGAVGTNTAPPFLQVSGVPGAVATGGNLFNTAGNAGTMGAAIGTLTQSGGGAHSPLTGGGGGRPVVANTAGQAATAPGAGGSGGALNASQAGTTGGVGGAGCVIIEEYA